MKKERKYKCDRCEKPAKVHHYDLIKKSNFCWPHKIEKDEEEDRLVREMLAATQPEEQVFQLPVPRTILTREDIEAANKFIEKSNAEFYE